MWWRSQPGLSAVPRRAYSEPGIASVYAGDSDEFKPEYSSPALAG
jgi:hypothetical protein